MSTPLYDSVVGREPNPTTARHGLASALRHPVARAVLAAATLLGITGDALMNGADPGLGFTMWVALIGLNMIALLWSAGRLASRETALWLSAAVLFAVGLTWRNSGALQGFDILACAFCLGMAAVATRDARAALFARRLRDTFFTATDVVAGTMFGVLPLVFREAALNDRGQRAFGRSRALVRPAILAGLAVLIFGSLLRGADPIFASIVSLPAIDFDTVVSHVLLAGFLTWILAGWARAGLAENVTPRRAPAALPVQLDSADITAALGTLIVLFAAFVATQLGWLFGGEQFLRERTGLTAAAYARQGFFQMVWVVTLVVPVLVATRAALRPDPALARRHTLLAIPVIVLLGAIVLSAMLRMRMYVDYYGLTTDRLYPLVFMLWLSFVIAWLAATVLRGWGRPFVSGSVISGLATLSILNVIDPDAVVARVNIARANTVRSAQISAPERQSLDLSHLATLSGGGVTLATRALIRDWSERRLPTDSGQLAAVNIERCASARELLRRWGPASRIKAGMAKRGAWRSWNSDNVRAVRVLGAHTGELRVIEQASCPPPAAAGAQR